MTPPVVATARGRRHPSTIDSNQAVGPAAQAGARWWTERTAVAAALVAAAGLFVVGQVVVRAVEAAVGAWLSALVVPGVGPVRLSGTTFALWAGTPRQRLFDVAGICTVAPYAAAGFLLAAGIVLWDGGPSSARMVRRAVLVAGLLVAVNVVRITVIVACVRLFGFHTGYTVGHRDLGTLLMLGAFGTGLYLLAQPVLGPTKAATDPRE